VNFRQDRINDHKSPTDVKILFYNTSNGIYGYASGDPNAVGGAERQQWLLARALASIGWSVTVGIQNIPELTKGVLIDGVRFVSFTSSNGPSRRLLDLYRFVRVQKPNWWYWRCAYHLLGPCVVVAKTLGVKTIFAAGFDSDIQPQQALQERLAWWPLYAWGFSHADRILVQHDGQFFGLPIKLRKKATVVPSLIHVRSTTKSHYQRENYVAWVGMLRQPKRPDLLIEIARNAPDIRFTVCGAPNSHRSPARFGENVVQELKRLPNVDFQGQVPPHKAQEIIENSAVLLSTSDEEGFPNTFLQAWASGTPVVSLRIDPNRIIECMGLGEISGNTGNAIAQIRSLIGSPASREEIAARARQYVDTHHNQASVIAAFESAIGKAHDVHACPGSLYEPFSPTF